MTVEVLYIGGPRHGEREALPGSVFHAPRTLAFPTMRAGQRADDTTYRRAELADTPGAITYVYDEPATA